MLHMVLLSSHMRFFMLMDLLFENDRQKPIDGSTNRGNLLEKRTALGIAGDSLLKRLGLSAYPANTHEYFTFVLNEMRHGCSLYWMTVCSPGEYTSRTASATGLAS